MIRVTMGHNDVCNVVPFRYWNKNSESEKTKVCPDQWRFFIALFNDEGIIEIMSDFHLKIFTSSYILLNITPGGIVFADIHKGLAYWLAKIGRQMQPAFGLLYFFILLYFFFNNLRKQTNRL